MAEASTDSGSDKPNKVTFVRQPLDASSNEAGPVDVMTPRTATGLDETRHSSKKIGHRRVDKETGSVTYKKVKTSDLMGAIQLGISNSIGSLANERERDLLLQDFEVIERTNFPRDGTTTTPAHDFGDFRFKTYAPIAFRYFRELFSIQPGDYLVSMSEPMRELSNPGASGSVFYVSQDDQFIIKTVQHKEAEFLQKLLPGYYMNLQQNKRTLLPKFFGLYCYQSLGKNVRLLSMNNLLPSSLRMHQKFDLKGSTYKRRASPKEKAKDSPTLKDLDWMEMNPEGIYLEASTYDALINTISRDCLVLQSFKIMDYSLLIGIHNIDQTLREEGREDEDGATSSTETQLQRSSRPSSINKPQPGERRVARNKSMFSAWDAIQTGAEPLDLGEGYPVGGIPARNAKGDRLLIFLGIIDILQSYRLFKKLEHTWKSVLHDGDTVSVHRPGFYASRFQTFLKTHVFQKIPSPLRHSPSRRNRTRRGTSGSVEERREAARTSTDAADKAPTTARPELRPTPSLRHPALAASPQGSLGLDRSSAAPLDHSALEANPPPKVERLFAPESSSSATSSSQRQPRLSTSSDADPSSSQTTRPEVTHL